MGRKSCNDTQVLQIAGVPTDLLERVEKIAACRKLPATRNNFIVYLLSELAEGNVEILSERKQAS